MQEKLKSWCESVVEVCNEYGKQVNLDYYCFQSPLPTESPELMVIGINPGGTGPFRHHEWNQLSQGVNIYSVRHPHSDNLPMVRKLARVFTTDFLQDSLEDALAMNVYYFNTKDTELMDSKLDKEIKKFCEAKTKEVIGIINSKKIIFLCSKAEDLAKIGVKEIRHEGNSVKTGFLGDKKVISIPNPGYYVAYSYENGKVMGEIIEGYLKE